jgi:glycosyltransferase involved in cell wall biosynthesis
VVASRLSGIPELVADGVTGLLAEPGDADALADRLALALSDHDGALRRAERGRRRVEEDFDVRRSGARMAALFTSATAGRTLAP